MCGNRFVGFAAGAIVLWSSQAFGQMDLRGAWSQRLHEDAAERGPGSEIGDYLGLPINDAAKMRADSFDAAKWTVPEHQCEPHPADYAPHGPANLWIDSELDPQSFEVIAYKITYSWMTPTKIIWMDGRQHPPAEAPHTWMGFSTGEWDADTLVVTTTHLKEGWLRRNGIPRDDYARVTEYFMRRGHFLTVVMAIEDPVYMTEPLVRSWNLELNPGYQMAPYTCSARVEIQRPEGFVAHHLPGTNTMLGDFAQQINLPLETVRGGAETMYPEYLVRLRDLLSPDAGP